MTLDTFEALVFSQRPASTSWMPVTDYSLDGRRAIEAPHAALILQTFGDVSIADLGCGPDAILVRLLQEAGASDVVGYDVQIDNDRRPLPNTGWADLASEYFMVPRWFSLVICREVLEHLTLLQIRRAVRNLCTASRQFVYVTTRFSAEHDLLHVETSDDLDPTHITIPSKDLLRLLFVLEGFRRREDLEEAMDWQHKNRCLVYERVTC